ncbi:putative complement C4-B-like [Sesbania bispinosa]|nr:putative complement C4-B-like [Sesbania bispinosa]
MLNKEGISDQQVRSQIGFVEAEKTIQCESAREDLGHKTCIHLVLLASNNQDSSAVSHGCVRENKSGENVTIGCDFGEATGNDCQVQRLPGSEGTCSADSMDTRSIQEKFSSDLNGKFVEDFQLCEVPIIEVCGDKEMETLLKRVANRGMLPKKRGRPRKKNLCPTKVSVSDLEFLNISLSLGPSEIAERVWDIGEKLGVTLNSGTEQAMIDTLKGMEIRDRKVVGRGGLESV